MWLQVLDLLRNWPQCETLPSSQREMHLGLSCNQEALSPWTQQFYTLDSLDMFHKFSQQIDHYHYPANVLSFWLWQLWHDYSHIAGHYAYIVPVKFSWYPHPPSPKAPAAGARVTAATTPRPAPSARWRRRSATASSGATCAAPCAASQEGVPSGGARQGEKYR